MPEFEQEDFKFPDEQPEVKAEAAQEEDKFELESEDDTPPEDRGREPMSVEAVKKLEVEVDELDKYSLEAKEKMMAMKKVWHDERRAKEAAAREREEAIRVAQQLLDENKKLKQAYSTGEQEYINTVQSAAELQLEVAKRAYKEALDSGESEAIADAQLKLNEASYKSQQVKNFKPTALQEEEKEVQIPQVDVQPQGAPLDSRTAEWLDENTWYGEDEEMSATALGLHSKLEKQFGKQFVGSEEYFSKIDATMRKRYPEYFGSEVKDQTDAEDEKPQTRAKPAANVVAPAARSTAPKKVKLTQTQIAIAKKLGVPLDLYAKKVAEQMNGGQ